MDYSKIKDYSIKGHENDVEYVIKLIEDSQKSKYYFEASEDVKRNHKVVSVMINTFKENLELIDEIASNYLKGVKSKIDALDIIVDLCNFTKDNDEELYSKYRLLFDSYYVSEYDEMSKNSNGKVEINFLKFMYNYAVNEKVVDEFARSTIHYILERVDIEKEILNRFENPNYINNFGLINYAIAFLNEYDPYLGNYASNHKKVLDELQEKINEVQVNWNKKDIPEERERYETMFKEVHKYFEGLNGTNGISEKELLFYIANELRLTHKFALYSDMDIYTYYEVNSDVDNVKVKELLESPNEKRIYDDVKDIIESFVYKQNKDNKKDDNVIIYDFNSMKR